MCSVLLSKLTVIRDSPHHQLHLGLFISLSNLCEDIHKDVSTVCRKGCAFSAVGMLSQPSVTVTAGNIFCQSRITGVDDMHQPPESVSLFEQQFLDVFLVLRLIIELPVHHDVPAKSKRWCCKTATSLGYHKIPSTNVVQLKSVAQPMSGKFVYFMRNFFKASPSILTNKYLNLKTVI